MCQTLPFWAVQELNALARFEDESLFSLNVDLFIPTRAVSCPTNSERTCENMLVLTIRIAGNCCIFSSFLPCCSLSLGTRWGTVQWLSWSLICLILSVLPAVQKASGFLTRIWGALRYSELLCCGWRWQIKLPSPVISTGTGVLNLFCGESWVSLHPGEIRWEVNFVAFSWCAE